MPAVAEFCRKAVISDATFYNWQEVCRLIDVRDEAAAHQLGEENSKLQRIVRRPEKHPIRVSMKPAAAHSAYLEPAAARTLSPC